MKIILSLIIATSIVFGLLVISSILTNIDEDKSLQYRPLSSGINTNKSSCTLTQTRVGVGHQLSTTILSANSARAWAMVMQPLNATNTVAIGLGSTAVFGDGVSLQNASTTNGFTSFKFGLNTELPYVGAVTALTSTGSTTLQVIQCVYNP